MKKIVVVVTLALFMVTCGFNQASYAGGRSHNRQQYQARQYQTQQYRQPQPRRYHHRHHSDRNLAIALGVIALTAVVVNQNRQPVN